MLKEILEVFTKEYRQEGEYMEYARKMIPCMKLKDNSEDVDDKIQRLMDEKFVSNCNIKIGEF